MQSRLGERSIGSAMMGLVLVVAAGCSAVPPAESLATPAPSPSATTITGSSTTLETVTTATPTMSAMPTARTMQPAHVEIGDVVYLGEQAKLPPRLDDAATGAMTGSPPADTTHPMPRVVISVLKLTGKVKRDSVQAAARAGYWGKVIECYRPGALKNQSLRGETTLSVKIAKGTVQSARVITPMRDRDVSACFAKRMAGLAMPKSRGAIGATMTIEVSPGDEPLPPLEADVERGPGTLDLAHARSSLAEALPDLERCYADVRAYAPMMRGWMVARVGIDRDGRAGEAFEVMTQLPDLRLARCALHRLRKLTFDPPSGGAVRVLVPIRFVPEAAREAPPTAGDRAGAASAEPTPEAPAPPAH